MIVRFYFNFVLIKIFRITLGLYDQNKQHIYIIIPKGGNMQRSFIYFSLILITVSSLFFGGCGSSGDMLSLGQVSGDFTGYEGKENLDIITGKYEYNKVGVSKYDDLFLEAAKFNAKFDLIQHGLTLMSNDPTILQGIVSKATSLSSTFSNFEVSQITDPNYIKSKIESFSAVNITQLNQMSEKEKYCYHILKLSLTELPSTLNTAENLKSKLTSLNPTADFTGMDALKAPKAVSGVTACVSNLAGIITSYPGILKEFVSVLASF